MVLHGGLCRKQHLHGRSFLRSTSTLSYVLMCCRQLQASDAHGCDGCPGARRLWHVMYRINQEPSMLIWRGA